MASSLDWFSGHRWAPWPCQWHLAVIADVLTTNGPMRKAPVEKSNGESERITEDVTSTMHGVHSAAMVCFFSPPQLHLHQ